MVHRSEILRQQHPLPLQSDLLAQIWSNSAQILSNLAQFGQPKSAFRVMNRGESRVPDCAKLVLYLHSSSANLL
ncbi:hypothetical protein LC609_30340 [Nostoc sp. XA013]|nr:hypothetical protein [Nostoc sp. XA013]